MLSKRTSYQLVVFSVFLIYSCLSFADYEPIDNIKKIAKDFITSNVRLDTDESMDVQINTSDVPSQLAACPTKVDTNFPKDSAREKITSVELSCNNADKSWHTFLPVSVQIFTKVVVASHPISPEEVITESDVDYAQANVSRLYAGYFKDKNDVVGQITMQLIDTGGVISKRSIHHQQLVHKNQEIDLVARANSIEVVMKGIAKSDGALNDTITAYNPSSKKMLEAIVIGMNKAEVI